MGNRHKATVAVQQHSPILTLNQKRVKFWKKNVSIKFVFFDIIIGLLC